VEFIFEHIIFLLAAFLAAVLATLAGFGSSTLLIPISLFFMDIKTAVFLVACFHLFNNLFKVRLFFRKIDFKTFWLFGIPSILFAFLGARFISEIPTVHLIKSLAVFLILFSVYSLWNPHLKIAGNRFNAILGGTLSGFLAGLIGLGGAIRAMFLVSFGMSREVYVATAALIALVVDLTRIPTYLWTGLIHDRSYYVLLPWLLIIAYIGVRTGKILLEKISHSTSRKIILIALLLVGIKLLLP